MSLFRKLVILFGVVMIVVLSATLATVYSESRQSMINLSQQKAISIIQTIDSALLSNVPDYQFEDVLLNLKKQDPNIISFDIYKLNDSLYDIASTNPEKIGTQASPSSVVALGSKKTITSLHGTVMDITVPITGYAGVIYDADVRFSIADDLKSTQTLLMNVLLVGLCAMILAIFSAWLFTREFLSKPVLAVVSAVNDVAAGNLQADLTRFKRRRDEIGQLTDSIDVMVSALRKSIRSMRETADELSKDFDDLVKHGDYTASGALHVSDVITQLSKSVMEQESQLTRLIQRLNVAEVAVGTHGWARSAASREDLLDEWHDWLDTLQKSVDDTQTMGQNLLAVSATSNGQLGAIQQVNHTAARLSQMASELRELIATFEV